MLRVIDIALSFAVNHKRVSFFSLCSYTEFRCVTWTKRIPNKGWATTVNLIKAIAPYSAKIIANQNGEH